MQSLLGGDAICQDRRVAPHEQYGESAEGFPDLLTLLVAQVPRFGSGQLFDLFDRNLIPAPESLSRHWQESRAASGSILSTIGR